MIRYTNQKVESRHAVLALNMLGGGGFEIWQYTSKVPQPAAFNIELGDLGFYACKMKSRDVLAHHKLLTEQAFKPSPVSQLPDGRPSFWITDPNGNPFQVVEGREWFKETGFPGGGVLGSVFGVSNMEASLKFYSGVLGISEVVYDKTGAFADLEGYENRQYRRVLLRKPQEDNGTFARLLGGIEIELVQWLDGQGRKIFENRCWGDRGFIHLCFDVIDMKGLKQKAEAAGHPFTVDSGDTFGMGEAGGRFAYMEDPDGAWVEMVETHKVPILKKLGWCLKLDDRKRRKPLPNWMVSLLGLNVIKD
jgi:catechol 2,3-dioxygenase-like lactoylglutathione lyase family enzyme